MGDGSPDVLPILACYCDVQLAIKVESSQLSCVSNCKVLKARYWFQPEVFWALSAVTYTQCNFRVSREIIWTTDLDNVRCQSHGKPSTFGLWWKDDKCAIFFWRCWDPVGFKQHNAADSMAALVTFPTAEKKKKGSGPKKFNKTRTAWHITPEKTTCYSGQVKKCYRRGIASLRENTGSFNNVYILRGGHSNVRTLPT